MSQTTLTATFSEDVDNGGVEYPSDGGDYAGCNSSADGRIFRVAFMFDPSSISGSDTISLVELIVECDLSLNVSSDSWYLGPYNTNGQGNPSSDSGATAYSRCSISGSNYGTYTDFRATGLYTLTLGGSVNSHLEAAIDAASVFTVACQQVDESLLASAHGIDFKEYVDGTNPPKLRVTHAAATQSLDPILAVQNVRTALSLIAH